MLDATQLKGAAALKVQQLWRAMCPRQGRADMTAFHQGDDPEAERVTMAEDDFLEEGGRIGEIMVARFDRQPHLGGWRHL